MGMGVKGRMVRKAVLDDAWEQSSINMIRGSHPPQTMMSIAPMLLLLKELDTPRFTGSLEDYADWRIAIWQFTGLLASEGGVLPPLAWAPEHWVWPWAEN